LARGLKGSEAGQASVKESEERQLKATSKKRRTLKVKGKGGEMGLTTSK